MRQTRQLPNGPAITLKTYAQTESSDQQCVNMSNTNATVQWTLNEAAYGFVIRYSIPDGQTATLGFFMETQKLQH